jgi:tetratricopeptide (TPR) repeat protein
MGMYEEALNAIQKDSGKSRSLVWRGIIYAHMGDLEKAEQALDESTSLYREQSVNPVGIALIYFTLDLKEQGLDCLKKAYDYHKLGLTYIKTYPEVDPVRSDPRFIDLLKKMELED